MRTRRLVVFGLLGIVAASRIANSATPAAQLASACASCHRHDGQDSAIAPLVGMNEGRLVDTMLAYRSGERSSQIMQVVAAALSREQIDTVAHYLARQSAEARR